MIISKLSYLIRKSILVVVCLVSLNSLFAQRVYPLVSGIFVDSILEVKPGASKIALDPITGNLFYSTADLGNIYEIFIPGSGSATDSLRFTTADYGITSIQGLCFYDSTIYVCGNIWSSTTSIGKIVKGTLQSNGTRIWVEVVTTVSYPSASSGGDHGFTGVCIDKAGNNIYVSSGSRTSFGEVRDNGGTWPGNREVPLSSHIFKFPISTVGLVLPNDSTLLTASGYIFASGTRNAYDLAWDGNDTLFAVDNSGERDDPEELNWLRQGKHYGFPWRMGGNNNPLRNSPYDASLDPLVNPLSWGYMQGWFADDPSFPLVPSGVVFTEPVRNYGLVADFYRDSISGSVKNASDEGTFIASFSSHRSPLGLVFDKDSLFDIPFRGDGFVLNFMPGGDSSGYSPISPWGGPCPFVDPSRELVQIKLVYDLGIDNYTMTTSSIVEGFYLPVDAELINNTMYIIENGGDLWKITFPSFIDVGEEQKATSILVYPNPTNGIFTFDLGENTNSVIVIRDISGRLITTKSFISRYNNFDLQKFADGIYTYEVITSKGKFSGKIVKE